MAFGLDFLPTDRFILTEKCDGSCIKHDWVRIRRPRFAKQFVLMSIYAFVDGSGNDTAGFYSHALVVRVGSFKLESTTLRSSRSAFKFLSSHYFIDTTCYRSNDFEQRIHTSPVE